MSTPPSWSIGNVRVTKITELVVPIPLLGLLPNADPDEFRRHLDWLAPHFVDEDGRLVLSIHALVVESAGRRIVVDTCIGNDKTRPYDGLGNLQTSFLTDLEAAGFPAESIDVVVCTHLHFDHVGWNTRLVDGQWVPTFPKARYLFGRAELAHWSEAAADVPAAGASFPDSVQPVLDAGLADLVESDHRITDEVWLVPTPGHTPGHHSVHVESDGQVAVITGDLAHHPVQFAVPSWGSNADSDAAAAVATRCDFLRRYGDSPALVIGTHFAGPTAGHAVRHGETWRFAPC